MYFLLMFIIAKNEIIIFDKIFTEVQKIQETQHMADIISLGQNMNNFYLVFGNNCNTKVNFDFINDFLHSMLLQYKQFIINGNFRITTKKDKKFKKNFYLNYFLSTLKNISLMHKKYENVKTNVTHTNFENEYSIYNQITQKNLLLTLKKLRNQNIIFIDNSFQCDTEYKLFLQEIAYAFEKIKGYTKYFFINLKLVKSNETYWNENLFPKIISSHIVKTALSSFCILHLKKRIPFDQKIINNNEQHVLGNLYFKKIGEKDVINEKYFFEFNLPINESEIVLRQTIMFRLYKKVYSPHSNYQIKYLTRKYPVEANFKYYKICYNIFRRCFYFEIFSFKSNNTNKVLDLDDTNLRIDVFICYGNYCDFRVLMTYYYFVTCEDNLYELSNLKNHKTYHLEIQEGQQRLTNFIETILGVKDMMFIDFHFSLSTYQLIIKHNRYVPQCSLHQSLLIKVKWRKDNFYTFYNSLCFLITKKSKCKVLFTLYEYKIDAFDLYVQHSHDAKIFIFSNIKNLQEITNIDEINCANLFNDAHKVMLQICFECVGYNQYYYVFLPAYEFNMKSFKKFYINNKITILSFAEHRIKTKHHNVGFFLQKFLYNLFLQVANNLDYKIIFSFCFDAKKAKKQVKNYIYSHLIIESLKSNMISEKLFKQFTDEEITVLRKINQTDNIFYCYSDYFKIHEKLKKNLFYVCLNQSINNLIDKSYHNFYLKFIKYLKHNKDAICIFQIGGKYAFENKEKMIKQCILKANNDS